MASKYRQKYELPEGFYDVLENYSREVLRDQPQDILEFSYLYFKAIEDVSNESILVMISIEQMLSRKLKLSNSYLTSFLRTILSL